MKTADTHFAPLLELVPQEKAASYRLAAFDMDGTLLNGHHVLAERTIAAIKGIADQGVTVLLATGRMMAGVRDHLQILGTPGVVVSHNGALVKNALTGEIYHHEKVNSAIVSRLLDLHEEHGIITHLNLDDDIYYSIENPTSVQFSQDLGVEDHLKRVDSLRAVEGEPTTVLMMNNKEVCELVLQTIRTEFADQFDHVLIPGQGDLGVWQLQFLPPKTSKGSGVIALAKSLGIAAEEIVSFGDSYNDLEMIEYTGLGIAMGNACQELKDKARFVTLTNTEDGVAQALEALFRL